ncbi:hypothetical protein TVAG_044670 [Trichomonas vaginalis G3]|uniref:DUF3447 domain-containing protein n=1 Tax=Trichomonas vaginalis (strain ATCC PRA-98 / G3) TaxID=412133 RepID=A2EY38_TRIV3|nr:protein kinase protein [Trichomonas vaginalis G3]EAY02448.1 hypothetical protein TVAG_044670 [Trichomonas vaginalis G3]KAI5527857.1 protein kinase protein [Trichomonas vaginalis G3]|eukprot:XP_001330688.1 hypothetical protein [Trichomonas vaginalis G3]
MSDQDTNTNKYDELRNIYKYYIDSYTALYRLKTENEEELNTIYNMIKTELIDSNNYFPKSIVRDILNIIPYNNRYTKSYLYLAKRITDDYHVTEVNKIPTICSFLFYKEYGITLYKYKKFKEIQFQNPNIHSENNIFTAIMDNDKERFIQFIERDDFDKEKTLYNSLYPIVDKGATLLELCCYHGAVDCFKLLRTKFDSQIAHNCIDFSFLGRNQEIMSECLKHQKPDEITMKYAIISHNIDFVTFLMSEYNSKMDLLACGQYKNLESLLVYFDQKNDINKCFIYSMMFDIPSLCEYFLYYGANINEKDLFGKTALHYMAANNSIQTAPLLLSRDIKINEKDNYGKTALHYAAENNSKEIAELLLSHGANINEKDRHGKTALHYAAENNSKEIAELLLSHGANINEKDDYKKTALHYAAENDNDETAELLISFKAKINEKDEEGKTAFHYATYNDNIEMAKLLLSHGAKVNERDKDGERPLHKAAFLQSKKWSNFFFHMVQKSIKELSLVSLLFNSQHHFLKQKSQNFFFYMVQKSIKKMIVKKQFFMLLQT